MTVNSPGTVGQARGRQNASLAVVENIAAKFVT